jgi:hypothetical protein
LSLAQIGRLCPRQVRWIYFRSNEEKKRGVSISPKQAFYEYGRLQGWKDKDIEARWLLHVKGEDVGR